MSNIKLVSGAPDAPSAIGPYSQAAIVGNMVFLSGQVPLDPVSMQIVEGGIEAQAERVMLNLAAVLKHLKLSFASVAKTTILLTDMAHFQVVNGIYERFMGTHKPARATFAVAGLPKAALIEIEMIASLS